MAQLGPFSEEIETLGYVLSLVEAFRAFDGDNDGLITSAELGGIMGSLGYKPSEEEVSEMMRDGDSNKDGLLSINEFLDMNTKNLGLGELASYLRTAFQALSALGDELVTGEELFQAMENGGSSLSLQSCQEIVDSIDGDGDGAVSLEDFKLILYSLL